MTVIPLVKANTSTKKKSSTGKAKNKGSHTYMPAPGGMGKPVKEGDVVEFHHPKHQRKHRGRVTAVGQDGYRARVSDGSAVDVPHSHHLATLPAGDFGDEKGLSPQDAKEAFLGPTREGGLPATDMQVAILDVMAQHGFPIDEDNITKINYDDARRLISKFIMDDSSGDQYQGPGAQDGQPGGSEAKDGTDMAPDASQGPTGGPPPPPAGGEGGEDQEGEGGPPDLGNQEPPDSDEDVDAPGNDTTPTGALDQPPSPDDDEDEAQDGTDTQQQSQDLRGPAGKVTATGDEDAALDKPEVKAAIMRLIEILEGSSESVGKKLKDEEKPVVGGKKGSKKRA